MAEDRIDAAIAAAAAPRPVRGATLQITLPTGRPAMLTVPADITELEIIGMVNAMIAFGMDLRNGQPASRILLPQ